MELHYVLLHLNLVQFCKSNCNYSTANHELCASFTEDRLFCVSFNNCSSFLIPLPFLLLHLFNFLYFIFSFVLSFCHIFFDVLSTMFPLCWKLHFLLVPIYSFYSRMYEVWGVLVLWSWRNLSRDSDSSALFPLSLHMKRWLLRCCLYACAPVYSLNGWTDFIHILILEVYIL